MRLSPLAGKGRAEGTRRARRGEGEGLSAPARSAVGTRLTRFAFGSGLSPGGEEVPHQ